MDFFGLGTGEIVLIFIIALIVFGPGKLPEFARKMGKAINTLKQTSAELTSQITRELDLEESTKRSHSPFPQEGTTKDAPSPRPPETKPDNNTGTQER